MKTCSATTGESFLEERKAATVLVSQPEPRVQGRTSDLRYEVNDEDPRLSRWPELKARISTAGFDPGAA